jgi:hypothetical protein
MLIIFLGLSWPVGVATPMKIVYVSTASSKNVMRVGLLEYVRRRERLTNTSTSSISSSNSDSAKLVEGFVVRIFGLLPLA